jgi:hypothetical protein
MDKNEFDKIKVYYDGNNAIWATRENDQRDDHMPPSASGGWTANQARAIAHRLLAAAALMDEAKKP